MDARFADSLLWIDRQLPRMVELLQTWGAINSGSHHLEGLAAQAKALRMVLQDLGDVRSVPLPSYDTISDAGTSHAEPLGEVLTVSSPRRSGPRVLLAIHYDTVFGKDDAFQQVTHLDQSTLRGPG